MRKIATYLTLLLASIIPALSFHLPYHSLDPSLQQEISLNGTYAPTPTVNIPRLVK